MIVTLLDTEMEKRYLKNCETCPHELIHGVACDWQPENCRYHKLKASYENDYSHKHSAWAMNLAEENEYDAVKSFG
jgi:hypothetical protein